MKISIHDAEHWITVHPNGREEKGEPLLIEGSNGHYVVKGGAGGKLNGKTVNPKSMSKGKETGGSETPTEQPKEAPKQEPKAEEPKAKEPESKSIRKHEVTPVENGDWREHSEVHFEVLGRPNLQRFTKHEVEEGKAQAFAELMDQYADKLGDRLPMNLIKTSKAKDFRFELEKAILEEISRKGDQSLPAEQKEASMQAAADKLAKMIEAHKIQKESFAKPYVEAYAAHKAEREAANTKYANVKRVPYKPAASVKEAADFAVKNNLASHANYGKLSLEIANATNESLQRHIEEFPELRKTQVFVGSCQAMNQFDLESRKLHSAKFYAELGYDADEIITAVKKLRAEKVSACWAFASPNKGIGFNENGGKETEKAAMERSLKRSVETKFHPPYCDTLKSIADHEYGHQLDYLLDIRKHPELSNIVRETQKAEGGILENLSGYAKKNTAEFIAEAWAEANNSPTPRPAAVKVAALIRSEYAKKFG